MTQPPVFPTSPFRCTPLAQESALSIQPQNRDASKISFLGIRNRRRWSPASGTAASIPRFEPRQCAGPPTSPRESRPIGPQREERQPWPGRSARRKPQNVLLDDSHQRARILNSERRSARAAHRRQPIGGFRKAEHPRQPAGTPSSRTLSKTFHLRRSLSPQHNFRTTDHDASVAVIARSIRPISP